MHTTERVAPSRKNPRVGAVEFGRSERRLELGDAIDPVRVSAGQGVEDRGELPARISGVGIHEALARARHGSEKRHPRCRWPRAPPTCQSEPESRAAWMNWPACATNWTWAADRDALPSTTKTTSFFGPVQVKRCSANPSALEAARSGTIDLRHTAHLCNHCHRTEVRAEVHRGVADDELPAQFEGGHLKPARRESLEVKRTRTPDRDLGPRSQGIAAGTPPARVKPRTSRPSSRRSRTAPCAPADDTPAGRSREIHLRGTEADAVRAHRGLQVHRCHGRRGEET